MEDHDARHEHDGDKQRRDDRHAAKLPGLNILDFLGYGVQHLDGAFKIEHPNQGNVSAQRGRHVMVANSASCEQVQDEQVAAWMA